MDVKMLLNDPIAFADVVLANFVQGNKDAERFIAHLTENLPMAQKARAKKMIARSVDESRSATERPATQIVTRKKAKKVSPDFVAKLKPFGIGAGAFFVGFFIVMPLMSVFVVPIFGFILGCLITIAGIWYAKVWKEKNLDDGEQPGETSVGL